MLARRFGHVFRAEGLAGVVRAVVRRLRMPRVRSYAALRDAVAGRAGLEIGGPSPMFARGGLLPLYAHAGSLDNCNFASETLWEGEIVAGNSFRYDARRPPGRQFIGEGGELAEVADGAYDFLLSSHMLEHSANPLRALTNWRRVLRPGGLLVMVLPHRDGVFDHRRPLTTLAHLREDFHRGTGEDDLTHLPEILDLHDLARDPGAGGAASFGERARRNAEVRSLHHHVFDARLAIAVLEEAGFELAGLETFAPYHILAVGRVPGGTGAGRPMSADERKSALVRSPFATDRA